MTQIYTSKELKTKARELLVGKYGVAIAASVIVMLAELIITTISSALTGGVGAVAVLIDFAVSLVINLLMGILIYGQVHIFLKIARGSEGIAIADLFYGFSHNMDKSILIQAAFTVFSIIGSIPSLLVNLGIINVTGIGASYYALFSYLFILAISIVAKLFFGLSFYLLDDMPDASPKDILLKSMELMKKNKGRLAYIYLSFIPVTLLGSCACFIGILWALAYIDTTLALFYIDVAPADIIKTPAPLTGSLD